MKRIASLIMGSRLHGLEQPDSDIDEFNIYVESFEELLRSVSAPPRDHNEMSDVTSYTLREIADGIERGQIGFVSMLWVPDSHIIEDSHAWQSLVRDRKKFLSRAIIKETHTIANILLNRDFKSAAHGLRILYSLFELTTHTKITFPSPISDELIQVRNGKNTYKQMFNTVNCLRDGILERNDWPETGSKVWKTVVQIYTDSLRQEFIS